MVNTISSTGRCLLVTFADAASVVSGLRTVHYKITRACCATAISPNERRVYRSIIARVGVLRTGTIFFFATYHCTYIELIIFIADVR